MELEKAQALIAQKIKDGSRHPDYKYVCDMATELKTFATGKGMAAALRRVTNLEDEAAFIQRIALTVPITSAFVGSVKGPFAKVSRNDSRIKKRLTIGDNKTKADQVHKMASYFNGSAHSKTKGLDNWLKGRYLQLGFLDPNSWVAVEWVKAKSAAETIKPRPFEISSKMAVDFEIINGVTMWLLVLQESTYLSGSKDNPTSNAGQRFTLYDQDFTVVWEKVDKAYLDSTGYVLRKGQRYIETEKQETWLEEWYQPNLGFVAADRVGYIPDDYTNGRTFSPIYGDALPFFRKSLKVCSEMDLTMALHTFPQKAQYYNKCKGVSKAKRCDGGYTGDGSKCSACNGRGFQIHTSAQDAILLPMPEVGEEIPVKLNELIAYHSPPIEILKFQDEYIEKLLPKIHQATFNSQALVKKNSTSSDTGTTEGSKTATEIDEGMQGVYDKLEPYTEKLSQMYCFFMLTFAVLAGNDPDSVDVDHIFPANPKLKTEDQLVAEYSRAKEAGAPTFLLQSLSNELADKNFIGDTVGRMEYDVKNMFFPFTGKSEDAITMLISQGLVPYRDQVLWGNFERIFYELKMENVGFYMKPLKVQSELLKAKIDEYVTRIEEEKPADAISTFRNAIATEAGASGNNGGDPNPGDPRKKAQNTETDNPID